MIIIAVIWCLIGAIFGIPRARARYRIEIANAKKLKEELDWRDVSGAIFEATLEQLKWTLLGIFSGISYIAWILLLIALANQKELEKPNVLGALCFSILVWVLGVLALERSEVNQYSQNKNA